MQNEANFLIADCGFRIRDKPRAGYLPCALPTPACGGQNAQNEPNSAKPAGGLACQRGKTCETNPICRANCAKRSQSAGAAQQWARGGRSAPPVPPEQNVRNEANLRRDGQAGPPPGSNVQNEPNFGADCAKRTQFPPVEIPHHSTIPSFQYSDAYRAKQSQFPGSGSARAAVSTLEEGSCDTFFDNLRLFLSGPFRGRVRGSKRGSSRP